MALGLQILKTLALLASTAPWLASSQEGVDSADRDLQLAMAEMKSQSYNGFVMLLQIVHTNNTGGVPSRDVTYLMPSDGDLATAMLLHYAGIEFLQGFLARHSIPQALRFNNLLHFPTGTLIPTYGAGRMVRVSNRGRSDFALNDSRIVSPNVCRATASIRCHGISAVIEDTNVNTNNSIRNPPPPRPEPSAPAPSVVPEVPPPPGASDNDDLAPVYSPAVSAFPPSDESPSPFVKGTASKNAGAQDLRGLALRGARQTSILLVLALGAAAIAVQN